MPEMKNAEQTKNSLAAFLVSRIAALRVRNNLSQRELSLRIGKESSYINRLEQSKFLPSVDTLYDIAEVCNSSLEEIFCRNFEHYAADRELLTLLGCLSKEKKESLIRFLQAK